MFSPTTATIRYKILAQHTNDLLIIEIIGHTQHLIKTAREILTDPCMLQGFSFDDVALIGVIAGMEIGAA